MEGDEEQVQVTQGGEEGAGEAMDAMTALPEIADDPGVPAADPAAELAELRRLRLESHRRALLAENAGRVVPELVAGDSVEALEASLEIARQAFQAAEAATMARIASTAVPAGNPVRQGPSPEALTPVEKIAYGLRRSQD